MKKVYELTIAQSCIEYATVNVVAESEAEAVQLGKDMELDEGMFDTKDDFGTPEVSAELTDEKVEDFE